MKIKGHIGQLKYSKNPNFLNEYRKAIASFPSMEIKIVNHGVQIANRKEGFLDPKDWPKYIKDEYYGLGRNKDTVFDKYYEAFNSKWYQELLQEGKDWCRKNCKVPNNFILQLWDDNGVENVLYIEVFEKIGEKASESYDDIAEEGIFGLFKKNKLPQATPEELDEMERLETDVKNKCVAHLKAYVKKNKFDQKYKDAICSYPAMNIRVIGNLISVCDTEDPFINPSKFPPRIKETYNKTGEVYMTGGKHPKEFNYMWAIELIKEAARFCNQVYKLPDKYEILANEPDGDDSPCSMYIEINLRR